MGGGVVRGRRTHALLVVTCSREHFVEIATAGESLAHLERRRIVEVLVAEPAPAQ